MILKCSKCGSQKYRVIGHNLVEKSKGNYRDYFIQKNKCTVCKKLTKHRIPLVSDKNSYRYIQVGNGRKTSFVKQLHRFIKELEIGRDLKPTERIKFINRKKGDVRPSNLLIVEIKPKRHFIKV